MDYPSIWTVEDKFCGLERQDLTCLAFEFARENKNFHFRVETLESSGFRIF